MQGLVWFVKGWWTEVTFGETHAQMGMQGLRNLFRNHCAIATMDRVCRSLISLRKTTRHVGHCDGLFLHLTDTLGYAVRLNNVQMIYSQNGACIALFQTEA